MAVVRSENTKQMVKNIEKAVYTGRTVNPGLVKKSRMVVNMATIVDTGMVVETGMAINMHMAVNARMIVKRPSHKLDLGLQIKSANTLNVGHGVAKILAAPL